MGLIEGSLEKENGWMMVENMAGCGGGGCIL